MPRLGERIPLEDRFWRKVREGSDGCWLWTGALVDGYGSIGSGGRYGQDGRPAPKLYAHRVAYELVVGKIPAAMQLDHLCRVRRCVNPAHLEVVTSRENSRRGVRSTVIREARCNRGHAMVGPNVYVRPGDGREVCRACRTAS